jgi:hypothetical protein
VFLVLVEVLMVALLMEMQEHKVQGGVPYHLIFKLTKDPSPLVELDLMMVETHMGKSLKGPQVQKATFTMQMTNHCSKALQTSMKVVRTL